MTDFYVTCDATIVRSDLPARPIMLSASSFERIGNKRGRPGYLPPANVPPQVSEIAVDPGGFQAQVRYNGYRFGWGEYIRWLYELGSRLSWAAFPDLPCEKELAADQLSIEARQAQTLEWAHLLWGSSFNGEFDDTEGFRDRLEQPWTWVATIQGRAVSDYVRMGEQMLPLLQSQTFDYQALAYDQNLDVEGIFAGETRYVEAWARRTAQNARVAIGSLCRREKVQEVIDIVRAVREILPNERFHLWGVKLDALGALRDVGLLPWIASTDSSAWNRRFGRDLDRINREQVRLGMSQRAYAVNVSLPKYLARVDRALSLPVQGRLAV